MQQAENDERLKQSRLKMLKDVGIVAISDFIILFVLGGFLLQRVGDVKNCSSKLLGVGIGLISYQAFFVVREFAMMIGCYFSKKPDESAALLRVFFSFIDWIGFSALIIWSTMVLSAQETEICRNEYLDVHAWWYICIIYLVFGYIYIVGLCCCWDLLAPIICCLVCVAMTHGSRHAHSRAQELRNRIPLANSIIEKLNSNTKAYTDLKDS